MFDSLDLTSLLPKYTPLLSSGSDDAPEQSQDGDGNSSEISCLSNLTWRERLIGCCSCMILGYLLSFGSFFRLKELLLGNPVPFVINATVGNLIALCGSCFFTGPKSQLEKMFQETRKLASIGYLVSMVLTLVVAFAPMPSLVPKGLILLVLLLVQYISITWYCLSYVPFARDIVRSYLNRMVSSAGDDG